MILYFHSRPIKIKLGLVNERASIKKENLPEQIQLPYHQLKEYEQYCQGHVLQPYQSFKPFIQSETMIYSNQLKHRISNWPLQHL